MYPAEPPGAAVAGRMPPDPATSELATRVRQLACVSLGIQSCCGLVILAPIFLVAAAVPRGVDYARFRQMCDDGSLPADTCRQMRTVLERICAARHEEGPECADHLGDAFAGVKDVLIGVAVAGLVVLCCCNLVPLCGYCGAKRNNQLLVVCFMVFNLLGAAHYALGSLEDGPRSVSLLALLLCLVLPALNVGYALALCRRQAEAARPRQVLAAPLLAPTGAVHPQQPQAHGFAPTQAPQQFQGQLYPPPGPQQHQALQQAPRPQQQQPSAPPPPFSYGR